MSPNRIHRLDGLEPDSLLAFLSLLGLLRCLEAAGSTWRPRASWTVGAPPLRPMLHLLDPVSKDEIAEAAVKGLNTLARHHHFPLDDLKLTTETATKELSSSAAQGGYRANLWASLVSDAARKHGRDHVEPTPLCLLHGGSHQHFLERLQRVPQTRTRPQKAVGPRRTPWSEQQCLRETLFSPWLRPDPITCSFRWDPAEDVRYAFRADDPTKAKTKATTQLGANRLAAIGVSLLTVVPQRRGQQIRIAVRGGSEGPGGFAFRWPIWRHPASLACVSALLTHPDLDEPLLRSALGVAEVRRARRISSAKNLNFTRAVSTPPEAAREAGRRARRARSGRSRKSRNG